MSEGISKEAGEAASSWATGFKGYGVEALEQLMQSVIDGTLDRASAVVDVMADEREEEYHHLPDGTQLKNITMARITLLRLASAEILALKYTPHD